jgi:hypothetical protein
MKSSGSGISHTLQMYRMTVYVDYHRRYLLVPHPQSRVRLCPGAPDTFRFTQRMASITYKCYVVKKHIAPGVPALVAESCTST